MNVTCNNALNNVPSHSSQWKHAGYNFTGNVSPCVRVLVQISPYYENISPLTASRKWLEKGYSWKAVFNYNFFLNFNIDNFKFKYFLEEMEKLKKKKRRTTFSLGRYHPERNRVFLDEFQFIFTRLYIECCLCVYFFNTFLKNHLIIFQFICKGTLLNL